MERRTEVYDLLAQVLSYPREEYPGVVRQCEQLLRQESPAAARPLEHFAERVRTLPLEDLEELFTRTFDLNPVCCLEVGWHLYGEDYNRGAFLVKMRQLLRSHGVAEGDTVERGDCPNRIEPPRERRRQGIRAGRRASAALPRPHLRCA